MNHCPSCGQPVDKEPICGSCGYVAIDGHAVRSELAGVAAVRPADTPMAAAPPPTANAPTPKRSRASVLLIAIAISGVGSLMLLASATRSPDTAATTAPVPAGADIPRSPENTALASTTAAAPVVDVETQTPRSSARWMASPLSRRGRAGASGAIFELAADEDIKVWRNRVRPVLTVRCAGKATEVFVMTYSAASIENNSSLHTVQVAFDAAGPDVQTWEHSVDHDALFAPNGRALARKIASARNMSFTFTPFNAAPVEAHFSVAGFDTQLGSAAAKSCG